MSDASERLVKAMAREVDYYPEETQPEVAEAVARAICEELGLSWEMVYILDEAASVYFNNGEAEAADRIADARIALGRLLEAGGVER